MERRRHLGEVAWSGLRFGTPEGIQCPDVVFGPVLQNIEIVVIGAHLEARVTDAVSA